MPSVNQSASESGDKWKAHVDDPDSDFAEAAKMLATKSDATIKALVRGIRDADRARAYIQAEIALADHDDRDPRKPLIGMLNAKVSDLKESDDGDTEDTDCND